MARSRSVEQDRDRPAPGHERDRHLRAITIAPATCTGCGTGLAPAMLSCPACHTLVHREQLAALAEEAQRQDALGKLAEAREAWVQALALLPATSRQHAQVAERTAALEARIAAAAASAKKPVNPDHPAWRRWLTSVGSLLLIALGKIKFLLLGLSKVTTLLSMLAYFGVYWQLFGWPLALGFALCLYVHEMGHVAALRQAGIAASAPVFIPGIGALVRLRQRVGDANTNATIGLAGPLWGLGAALAAFGAWRATGQPVWGAIAHLAAYLNLFNLLPVWQLDGARGMDALNRWERGVLTAVMAGTFVATQEKILVLIAAVALWRTFRAPPRSGNPRILALFAGLVIALGWLATVRV